MCVLRSMTNDGAIEWIVQEIERDRAQGVGVDIHVKSATTDAWAYAQWIDAAPLLRMRRELRQLLKGERSEALLDTLQVTGICLRISTANWQTFRVEEKVVDYFFHGQTMQLKTHHDVCFIVDHATIATFSATLERLARRI